jgi:RHS repeat-associated protein
MHRGSRYWPELWERGLGPSASRPRGRENHGTKRSVVASTHERGPRSQCLIAGGLPKHTRYDYDNRLTNVEINGTMAATYTYDALGRRIGIDDSGTQTWTVYNRNTPDDNPYADFTSAGALNMRYVDGLAVDELFARTDSSGNTAFYLRDEVGSVTEIVSTTATLDEIIYDPFGNIVTETNASNGDRFKFAGMEYDPVTGLYYDHARYYDSAIGRFISQDPMGFETGDADLYRYVGNQPTDSVDLTGLAGDDLPARKNQRDKTTGILTSGGGAVVTIGSGRNGFAQQIPQGTPGFDIVTRTHVEGHAIAYMIQNKEKTAIIIINNTPCSSCDKLIPVMLPPGATLLIKSTNGGRKLYTSKH